MFQGLSVSTPAKKKSLVEILPPSKVKTQVESGRLSYKLAPGKSVKHAPPYFRGNITLVDTDWQKVGKIRNQIMATLPGYTASNLPVLKQGKVQTFQFKLKANTHLACSYLLQKYTEDSLYLDVCYSYKEKNLHKNWSKRLLKRLAASELPREFRRQHRAFGRFDLQMPVGFLPVNVTAEKTYFIDTSGTLEAEVFSELSPGIKSSSLANDLYEKSIQQLVSRDRWKLNNKFQKKDVRCIQFTRGSNEQASYCFAAFKKKGQNYRLVILARYRNDFISGNFINTQVKLLQKWQNQ